MIDNTDAVEAAVPSAYVVVEWLPPEDPPAGHAEESRVALVRFFGEIDLGTAPAMGESVLRQVEQATAAVLDLTPVAFLDSAGVRLFDNLVGAFAERRIPIRLVAPAYSVARFTLRLCAFRTELLEQTIGEAREAVS
jgi:anti-sigma B factor antagonist